MSGTRFQSESILSSCLIVKEHLARSTCKIWRWSDCNWTRTQNHLLLKRTLNNLTKMTKRLSCVRNTCLYTVFDCMFFSSYVCVFRVNPYSIVALLLRNSLIEAGAKSEGEVIATGLEPRTTYFLNEQSTTWQNWSNDWAVFWWLICIVDLTVYSCHLTYAFSEWIRTL